MGIPVYSSPAVINSLQIEIEHSTCFGNSFFITNRSNLVQIPKKVSDFAFVDPLNYAPIPLENTFYIIISK